jgi:uncharacterized membrane protein YecN with MAPEG domain
MASKTVTAPDRRMERARARAPFGLSATAWPFIKVFVASVLSGLALFAGARLALDWQPDGWSVADRLALFAKSAVFAILPAVAAVVVVAAQRLNPDHWVGKSVRRKSALDINTRFIQNTVEQGVLFLVGVSGLSLYATPDDASAVPILAALFLTGRLLYWAGYHRNTYVRAYGFGLTFWPVVAVYAWLMIRMLTGLYIPI